MRAVKSDSDIRESSVRSWNSFESHRRRSTELLDMSTPAVLPPNLTRLRHSRAIDKSSRKRESHSSRSKKDLLPIGDTPEGCVIENTRAAVNTRKEQGNTIKETENSEIQHYKKSLTPSDSKPTEKLNGTGDEGFYDDEIQPHSKFSVLQEVQELVKKSEAGITKNEELSAKAPKNRKRRRLNWISVLAWVVTFSGAVILYFSVVVYAHEVEPIYTKVKEMLGWKEVPPPPPPTVKEEFFIFLEQMGTKLNNMRLSMLEKLSFPTG